jgi:hypothetical protein
MTTIELDAVSGPSRIAMARDGLNTAEKVVAAVCVVYPFRIFLNEVTGFDFHLGLVSFALLAMLTIVRVRERPIGFPNELDYAIAAFALLAVMDLLLLSGVTALAVKGLSVECRFAAFYFAARLLGLRRVFLGWMFAAIAAVAVAEAVVGALDYHLGYGTLLALCDRAWTPSFWKMGLPRLYSFAMDPLSVGYIFVFGLAGCVYLTCIEQRAWVVAALLAIWQALPLTLARVPVAFALGMTAAFAILDRCRGAWFAKISLLAIAAALGVYASRGMNQPLGTYAEIGGTLRDTSALVHESALRRGIAAIFETPLGHGLGEAGLVALYGGGSFPINETYYVTIGLQMGIPGMLLFLAVLVASGALWLALALRQRDQELYGFGLAGGALWLLLLSGGMFSGTWNMLVPQFYFWLLTGTAANVAAASRRNAG